MVALAVLLAAAGVALAMLPHRDAPAPPQAASAAPEELDASPAQTAVVDGGTLRLRDRVVRLVGVVPPTRAMACAGSDCGAAATNALAAMVNDTPVRCRLTGTDRLGRAYAVCQAGGVELNRAIIAAGWGRVHDGPPAMKQAEAAARAGHRGVWASEHDASW